MPAPGEHPAYDYAERIRERPPRRLQVLREAVHSASFLRG